MASIPFLAGLGTSANVGSLVGHAATHLIVGETAKVAAGTAVACSTAACAVPILAGAAVGGLVYVSIVWFMR